MGEEDSMTGEYAYMSMHREMRGEPEPVLEDADMLERVWGRRWGVDNDVGELRAVLVSRPGAEWEPMMSGGEYVPEFNAWLGPEKMWYWEGKARPDLERAQAQHDQLTKILQEEGVEVFSLHSPAPHLTRAVFTRDQAIIVPGGAVICRFGIDYRRGEERMISSTLGVLEMPILRTIHGAGLMEGGSFCWLNSQTAAVSIGHRSNHEGARQLEEILAVMGVELLWVDNVGYGIHIDGSLVMIDVDLALVSMPDLPWWFLERLRELGITTVDAHPLDGAFGVNCLAVRPGRVIMSAHAKRTADTLRGLGVEVIPVEYDELHKGGGGIHCSTLPLIRDRV